jgi:hypothetical protein
MIDELCNPHDAEHLWQQFLEVEKNAGGDRHRRLIDQARELCQKFEVLFPENQIPDLLDKFV